MPSLRRLGWLALVEWVVYPRQVDLEGPPSGVASKTLEVIQVSAGDNHTCAIKRDGTLACWGDDAYDQTTPPSGTFLQISAGYMHTCGVRTDGTAACWGAGRDDEGTAQLSGPFVQVSCGFFHACGVKTDGTVARMLGMRRRLRARIRHGTVRHLHAGHCRRRTRLRLESRWHCHLLGIDLLRRVHATGGRLTGMEIAARATFPRRRQGKQGDLPLHRGHGEDAGNAVGFVASNRLSS